MVAQRSGGGQVDGGMPDRMEGRMPAEAGLVFNVSMLLTETLGSRRRYELESAEFRYDEGRTPVAGTVRLTHTDGAILAEAWLTLEVEEICGRCLEPFEQALVVELQEEFWPGANPLLREPVEIPDGREGFPITDSLLDLQEALRQYVEMNRPMQPICRPDCAGGGAATAPGAAAVTETPESTETPVDHRWAALEELRREFR